MIIFHVEGNPRPQPRPRAFKTARGLVRMYDSASAEAWKGQIALAARLERPAAPLEGPISLNLSFRLSRPRGHFGTGKNQDYLKQSAPIWPVSKPDLDNLVKAVMDCLTTLGFWRDDDQVVQISAVKEYANELRPGVTITILRERG